MINEEEYYSFNPQEGGSILSFADINEIENTKEHPNDPEIFYPRRYYEDLVKETNRPAKPSKSLENDQFFVDIADEVSSKYFSTNAPEAISFDHMPLVSEPIYPTKEEPKVLSKKKDTSPQIAHTANTGNAQIHQDSNLRIGSGEPPRQTGYLELDENVTSKYALFDYDKPSKYERLKHGSIPEVGESRSTVAIKIDPITKVPISVSLYTPYIMSNYRTTMTPCLEKTFIPHFIKVRNFYLHEQDHNSNATDRTHKESLDLLKLRKDLQEAGMNPGEIFARINYRIKEQQDHRKYHSSLKEPETNLLSDEEIITNVVFAEFYDLQNSLNEKKFVLSRDKAASFLKERREQFSKFEGNDLRRIPIILAGWKVHAHLNNFGKDRNDIINADLRAILETIDPNTYIDKLSQIAESNGGFVSENDILEFTEYVLDKELPSKEEDLASRKGMENYINKIDSHSGNIVAIREQELQAMDTQKALRMIKDTITSLKDLPQESDTDITRICNILRENNLRVLAENSPYTYDEIREIYNEKLLDAKNTDNQSRLHDIYYIDRDIHKLFSDSKSAVTEEMLATYLTLKECNNRLETDKRLNSYYSSAISAYEFNTNILKAETPILIGKFPERYSECKTSSDREKVSASIRLEAKLLDSFYQKNSEIAESVMEKLYGNDLF